MALTAQMSARPQLRMHLTLHHPRRQRPTRPDLNVFASLQRNFKDPLESPKGKTMETNRYLIAFSRIELCAPRPGLGGVEPLKDGGGEGHARDGPWPSGGWLSVQPHWGPVPLNPLISFVLVLQPEGNQTLARRQLSRFLHVLPHYTCAASMPWLAAYICLGTNIG